MSQGGRLLTRPGPAPGGGAGHAWRGSCLAKVWGRTQGVQAGGQAGRMHAAGYQPQLGQRMGGWGGGFSQRPAAAAPGPAWRMRGEGRGPWRGMGEPQMKGL